VLLDFNQNSAGTTLAGAYSVRPTPSATVSTPITWAELQAGAVPRDFTIVTVPIEGRPVGRCVGELSRRRVDLMKWRDGLIAAGG
jgi:DNA primase